jgi:hypothetical protein
MDLLSGSISHAAYDRLLATLRMSTRREPVKRFLTARRSPTPAGTAV